MTRNETMDAFPSRITIERSGGFAGITMKWEVKREDLSEKEEPELEHLLAALDFTEYESTATATPQPDRFQYHVTIECDAGTNDITVREGAIDAPLKALIDWVTNRSRGRT